MTVCELWRDEKRVYSPTKAYAAAKPRSPGPALYFQLSRSGERARVYPGNKVDAAGPLYSQILEILALRCGIFLVHG